MTSIRNYEEDILVCAEITHKVMRKETVYTIMQAEYNRDQAHFRDNFIKVILGQTVLTKYNNKTYRIDDVNFDASPQTTFKRKDAEVSFSQYYQEVNKT